MIQVVTGGIAEDMLPFPWENVFLAVAVILGVMALAVTARAIKMVPNKQRRP